MGQCRAFALIFSSLICAFVLTFSMVTPGFGPTPHHEPAVVNAASQDADDPMMASLRLEANAALVQLQAARRTQ